MHLTKQNIRAWARSIGERLSYYAGPRKLQAVLANNNVWTCSECGGWFTDMADMSENDCDVCAECGAENDDYWADFDPQREWGTY